MTKEQDIKSAYQQGYSDFRRTLKTEIDRQEIWLLHAGYTAYNINIAFDSIKHVIAKSEVNA